MKKIQFQLFILIILCLLLISGCKNRQVKQLIDLPSTADSITSDIDSDSINTDDLGQPLTNSSTPSSSDVNTNTPSTASPVIIAESVNIDDVDERAIILNELDSLLNSVLTSLDDLDENPITEDITDLGGQ